MSDSAEPPSDIESGGGWIRRPLLSLTYREFRFFWTNNLLVALGLMVEFTARAWLIVQLTDSALVLGAVEGVFAVTFAGGSVPMGVVADRVNRRNLLLIGNALALITAAAVGALVIADVIAIWHIVAAAALGGLLMAVRFPASQAMTARLVPKRDLMNATSLNTASQGLPSVIGPALGGVLVGAVGIGVVYLATTGAYLLALLMLALGVAASYGHIEREDVRSVTDDLREAIEYLARNKDLLKLTAAALTPFLLGQSYVLLLPLFVEQELGRGVTTFGILSTSLGVGGVAGAMTVATFGRPRQIGYVMLFGVLAVGAAAVVYGLSPWPVLTGVALMGAGAGESAIFAAYETYLLTRLPDEIRGRVMGLSFTMVAFFPISAVAAGALADVFGLRAVAVVEGVGILLLAAVAWRMALRHVVRDGALGSDVV
ncbi:MAG: MFS transporter [Dehalococcoidia bacterium]|nr:MFS transporter [Dehalococcoidia bacterium]